MIEKELVAATEVIARFDMRECTTMEKSRQLAFLVLTAAELARAAPPVQASNSHQTIEMEPHP